MSRRFEQASNLGIVSAVERLTGTTIDSSEKNRIVRGADEIDLVNSGLEETMVTTYDAIRQTNPDSFVERPVRDGPWSARVSGREAPRAVGC